MCVIYTLYLFIDQYYCFYAERVAVKIIEKTGMDQKALKMLTREIANMGTVRHPAIVRYSRSRFPVLHIDKSTEV